jgi:uncharacterized protein YbaP (TraB family)
MEIIEVETIDEQLDIFLNLSPLMQSALLEEALNVDQVAIELKELYGLWKSGDEQTILSILDSKNDAPDETLIEEYAEYWDALNVRRNLKMTEKAELYMSEGKTVFYVVGLLHMLGDDGIVALLRQNGYAVERLRG